MKQALTELKKEIFLEGYLRISIPHFQIWIKQQDSRSLEELCKPMWPKKYIQNTPHRTEYIFSLRTYGKFTTIDHVRQKTSFK